MAGHSKWKQIKHKKALNDSKRGKMFTKLIKEITVAAKLGGGDPAGNPRLRFLIEKGKNINMPLDNVTRAIKKGTGELPGQIYEAHSYEGYGPGKVAIIVDVLTDNKNKAIADLRYLFSRHGGHVAETGSVNWMFERLGVLQATDNAVTEDQLLEALIDFDIRDIKKEDSTWHITSDPKSLDAVKHAVHNLGLKVTEAEIEWVAKEPHHLEPAQEEKALAFLEALEDLDDVQNVYTNLA